MRTSCCLILSALALAACESPVDLPQPRPEVEVHVRARWSPDGRTIAYSDVRTDFLGIYTVDTSGGQPIRIVQGEGVGLAWSPDGEWLAFSRTTTLHRVRKNGDSLQEITPSILGIRPAWHPSGSVLAFVRRDLWDAPSLWTFHFTKDTLTEVATFGDYPSWSSRGNELFAMQAVGEVTEMIAVDIASLSIRSVAIVATNDYLSFSTVHPNEIAFICSRTNPERATEIWRWDIPTGTHTQLTYDGGDYADWSPDGEMVVYTRVAQGDGGLWIMRADGTGKRRLTTP